MTLKKDRRNAARPGPRRNDEGFTLIELMIVVTIMGILMAIALPNYSEYVLKGKLAEASSQLATVQLRLEQYYQDNRTYASGGGCGVANFAGNYFNFTCTTTNSGQNFTLTATGTGAATGFIYTVNDASAKETTLPSGSKVSCWATNKSGSC